ncbi:MAG: PHP domain-containing protein [Bifidobacterium sp.]|jgi:predicted metal-dependent phosphoesterase TrpH|nr:PHP domain-containing protein [Bifidobacterium sp.]MCI1865393.1 PHP domain-containing protein [Bifidobacterium sp.]
MTRVDDMRDPVRTGWDIHCHTVFSDGTETPRTLIVRAREAGLLGVAIADHDTTSGWGQARQAARRNGLPLLLGTEITAEDDDVSVHMLAFQFDPGEMHIARMFEATRAARIARTKRMVESISHDYPITWDDVLAQVREGDNTTIGRPHIADALVAAGVYATRSQAFGGIVSGTSRYYIPTPSPAADDVVRTVKRAGGVSVIAHPGDPSRNTTLLSDDQIERLVEQGLDGLEVWHRGNPPRQRMRLLRLAQRWNLLVTGGSDWHGSGKPNRLGENLTDEETVREIRRRGVLCDTTDMESRDGQ